MKLEWMGEYRETVEALIHYCNIYSMAYKPEAFSYKGVRYSFALIQVVEYLLENEELGENMSSIAARLGITKSNFTKITNRLAEKGLVEKTFAESNRKNVILTVTPLGRELYNHYSAIVLRVHFSKMFEALDGIPKEYLPCVQKALQDAVTPSAQAEQSD